jgi:6-pyruvoyltetrahydropterin/6-carboxytetrahydropterin synthase
MARTSVTKEFKFSMGHALWNYEGKCANLHGHNYRCLVKVSCESDQLSEEGFVVDFGDLKEKVAAVVDAAWDHKTLLNEDDPRFGGLTEDHGVLRVPWNPTAENLAAGIFSVASRWLAEEMLDARVRVEEVSLWETDTGEANVSRR